MSQDTHRRIFQTRGASGHRRRLAIAAGFVVCLVFVAAICGLFFSQLNRQPVSTSAAHGTTQATSHGGSNSPVVFERTVWDGMLYDAAFSPSDAAKAANSPRFSDVYMPPPPGNIEDLWKKGGVIHLYGGGTPRVVVLGSSHALMYGDQIDTICRKLGVSVSFLCASGRPATPWEENADMAAYYNAQMHYLHQWKPDLVIVADRWDALQDRARPQSIGSFSSAINGYLTQLASTTRHITLFTQPPVLTVGEAINLREYVRSYENANSRLPVIRPDGGEAFRRETVGVFEAAAKIHPHLQIVRADLFFYNPDGSAKYLSGSQFLYADDDHLSEAGAALLHQPILDAIESACGLTSE